MDYMIFIWITEYLSHCIRREMDMWPYFCHNPASKCEGGLYFYMTTPGNMLFCMLIWLLCC